MRLISLHWRFESPESAAHPAYHRAALRDRCPDSGATACRRRSPPLGDLAAIRRRAGRARFYVEGNRLHFVNSFVGSVGQMVVGSEDISTGKA